MTGTILKGEYKSIKFKYSSNNEDETHGILIINLPNGVECNCLVDVSVNPPKLYCIVEHESVANEILRLISDNKAHENRIRILSNMNAKYREKLGISNEPMDLDLLTEL